MLISDIATIVQNSIGDRGGIMAKDDLVIFWVNEAILDVFRKTEIGRENPDSVSLVANDNQVTTGSNQILRMHYMHNGQFEMQESTLDELLNKHGVGWLETPGTPTYFYRGYVAGVTTVMIAPICDGPYTITFSATWTPTKFTLTSQNTNTLIPSVFDNDIIRFCVMRAHELEKDFQAAGVAKNHYDNNMFERADETHALDDSYSTISPDEWDYV